MNKIFSFLENPPIGLIFFGIFGGLLLNNKWIEPDTYAFFNRACLNGIDFNTPILSKYFFSILPCEQWFWFFLQALLWTIVFYTISFSIKHFLGVDSRSVFFVALSPFFLQLMTSFEDDFLALPIIVILTYWHFKRKDWISMATLIVFGTILSALIWEGSFLILSIIAVSVFHPILGLITIGAFYFKGIIGTNPNPANESKVGYGFGEYALFWFVLALFPKDWKKGIEDNWIYIKVAIPLCALAILSPKFGIYSTLPLIPIAYYVFEKKNYFIRLVRIGFIILMLFTLFFLFLSPPTDNHWSIINNAVKIQQSGEKVLNYWSLGDYFAYMGGIPSQRGGYAGFQDANGSYWLGPERKNCKIINYDGLLFLQKC